MAVIAILVIIWLAIVVLEAYGVRMRNRFTTRDLLWLIVVVAVSVAWIVDRLRLEAGYNSAIGNLRRFTQRQQDSAWAAIDRINDENERLKLQIEPPESR